MTTEGKWYIGESRSTILTDAEKSVYGVDRTVAIAFNEADARLIASSKLLLEALKLLTRYVERSPNYPDAGLTLIDKAKQAIKEAGE